MDRLGLGTPAAFLTMAFALLAMLRAADGNAPTSTDYHSANFDVYTDLPPDEAEELLGRLETMLGLVSEYWRAPLKGRITCYVVKDLHNWPAGSIPSDDGRRQIAAGAGVTILET